LISTLAWQAWQAWHLWHWARFGGALGLGMAPGCRGCWRGRRNPWKYLFLFYVIGIILDNIIFYSGVAGMAVMALGWLWWRTWF